MRLKQINICTSVSQDKIDCINQLIPVIKYHNNGEFFIKKVNKHFNNMNELTEFKNKISEVTGIERTKILFVYDEKS